jgi:hypothetical protein
VVEDSLTGTSSPRAHVSRERKKGNVMLPMEFFSVVTVNFVRRIQEESYEES